jgi:hypothetical protein
MGGGYVSQPSTSTQTSVPYLSGLVNQVGSNAQNILSSSSAWPQLYPGATTGSMVSPLTQAQQSGLAGLTSAAASTLPATTSSTAFANNLENGSVLANNPGMAPLQALASGSLTNPANNPLINSTVNTLTSNVIPGITSQFVAGGNTNNPAMAYAAGQGATNAIAPFLSNLYTTDLQAQLGAAQDLGSLYNQGVQSQTQGLALAPQTAGLPFVAPQEEYQAGALQQNQSQAVLNSIIQAYQNQQTMPETMTDWAAGIGFGAPGGTTSMTQPLYTNPTANTLGDIQSGLSTIGLLSAAF